MRSITLSKNLTEDIHSICIHYIENMDAPLSQDYEELRDMTHHDDRFKIVVTLEERIPLCCDTVINILVKHILDIVDCNEDDTEEMNAFYQYLEDVHGWDGECHSEYLLKATTIEALQYCVEGIIVHMGGDL